MFPSRRAPIASMHQVRARLRPLFQVRALGKHADDAAFSLFGYSKAVIAFAEVARIESRIE